VKIAKNGREFGPEHAPRPSDMKNTRVTEMKPRIGNRLQDVEYGTSSFSARALLAAQVGVGESEYQRQASAVNMRSVVRAAYTGRCEGSSDSGRGRQSRDRREQAAAGFGKESQDADQPPRLAIASQRVASRLRKAMASERFMTRT